MTDNSNGPSAGNDNLAFRAALTRGLVSRRSAMMGAAGLGAAAFLAACGSEGRNPSTPNGTAGGAAPSAKAAQDLSDTEKVVNWSNWTQYIDVSEDEKSRPTLDAFTKQSGIQVN
ncbi:MAG TPA: spermidine/putrescine ABC transporter substrate-binding protein, partial [Intrasporangium sp.]|nr:spermidine/putrescine ABC transporter substrate-binding protein [Intrasporangium sp.]